MQHGFARTINMMIPGTGSSSNGGSSSDMATERNFPSSTESQTNFGSSSIIEMERPSLSFNSRVMGFPVFQNKDGLSAPSAGNSAMNGRLGPMPSPLIPGTRQVMNLNGQIYPTVGNGMQNTALSGKGNKIY